MRHAIIGLVAWLLLGASWAEADEHTEKDPWKIGVLMCLTTQCANQGATALDAANLAVSEINARGGVLGRPIQLVVQDTAEGTSGATAVSAYRHLRTDPAIRFFIGPTWTGAGMALAPIIAKDPEVVIVTPSLGASEFHMAGNNLFNSLGTNEAGSRAAAAYAFNKGFRTAAVFASQQPWDFAQGNYFDEEFQKLGGKIVAREDPLPNATDLSAEALRIVRAKPDMVFLATMLVFGKAATELKRLGYEGFKMASYIDHLRLEEARGSVEGAVFFMSQGNSTDSFRQKFRERYAREPEREAASSYDTVYIYARAAEKSKTFEARQVREAISALSMEGASGKVEFDSKGCVKRTPTAWKVAGEGFVPLH